MIRPGSSLSKQKKRVSVPAAKANPPGKKTELSRPNVHEYLEKCDYVGAMTILSFDKKTGGENIPMWLAYAAFHNGDYKVALENYEEIIAKHKSVGKTFDPAIHLYCACCHYALTQYEQAETCAHLCDVDSPLKRRILFHVAHKRNNESLMMQMHSTLGDSCEDQMCLAAVQFLRSHFQEATDIYKRILVDNREHLAINVYIAGCYYKLDYYDVAIEILQTYLATQPDSITGVNLKACAHYQLYNGKAAEAELKVLQQQTDTAVFQDHDLLRHNICVFRNGESAMQVLPPLLDVIPEARLNLVIYYLKFSQDYEEAYNLIKDLEPSIPREYILKGVVYACLGQKTGSREHLKIAQGLFQLVGASASECDTIPGRQCMASCFFLLKQFEDVLVYLKSIKAYFSTDDDFNWNYGITCANVGEYKEAKEAFQMIQTEKYRSEFTFLSWLARCYIMNGEPQYAWETYVRMDTNNDSFNLLHVIANDCYKMGQFYYACKAFDVLERLDPDPEFWEGKRGAAVGVFQQVVAGKETPERLQEVVNFLRATSNPQVEYIINRVMKKWAKENRVRLE
ncbi:unnamed protein product [Amoebophrya sp. A25]|nr:unnamed protein product [Amoebophrya sp. A25]|eukprot:GSA25T00011724001.1